VRKLPTIRSEFSIDQFEAVLQRFAHALQKFTTVRTEDVDIEFRYDEDGKIRRINVAHHRRTDKNPWGDYWSFSIEPKAYMDSNHITKVSLSGGNEKKVRKFLEKIMKSEKPIPRFSLEKKIKRFPKLTRWAETKGRNNHV